MSRGAPDHTILVEQNFAHYIDRQVLRTSANIESAPAWTEALNVDIRGVWGYMWGWANEKDFNVRLTIDSRVVFIFSILQMKGGGFFGMQNGWAKFGCTQYSDVAGDKQFCMFYDEKWGLYVHKNLTIETQWAGGLGTLASWGIYYKELS